MARGLFAGPSSRPGDISARKDGDLIGNGFPLPVRLDFKRPLRDFPGGTVVKNPLANAGDTGSIPGLGRSHMPRSN